MSLYSHAIIFVGNYMSMLHISQNYDTIYSGIPMWNYFKLKIWYYHGSTATPHSEKRKSNRRHLRFTRCPPGIHTIHIYIHTFKRNQGLLWFESQISNYQQMVSTKLPLFRFAMSINVYGFSGARPNSSFSSTLASCDTGLGHCAATQGPTPTCCRAKLMLDEKILIRICYTIICKPRMQQLGNLKRGLCRFQCGTLIPFRDILGSFLQKLDFGLHFFSSLNH